MSPEEVVAAFVDELVQLAHHALEDAKAAQATLANWLGSRERITALAWQCVHDRESVEGPLAQLAGVRGLREPSGRLRSVIRKRGEELEQEARQTRRASREGAPRPANDDLPTVMINEGQESKLLDDAWSAIFQMNRPPTLFRFHGALCRRTRSGPDAVLEEMPRAAVHEALLRAATWVRKDRNGQLVHAAPPRHLAEMMVATPRSEIPEVQRIVFAPFVAPDRSVVTSPGLHVPSQTWLEWPDPLPVDVGPTSLGPDDVRGAVDLVLDDLLADFDFADQTDRAHALAFLLVPILRPLITGTTPLHLITSPARSAGKSLLARVAVGIHLGTEPSLTTFPEDPNEATKKITALLLTGRPFVLFDNVDKAMRGSSLASAATAPEWADRVLGASRMASIRNRVIWAFTGQNPAMTEEISRRVLEIRLQPKVAEPSRRPASGFRHPNLVEWATTQRRELLRALLIIIRWWLVQGGPRGDKTLGSFESWSQVIGGVLAAAGVPGFLQDDDRRRERTTLEPWTPLLLWWSETRPGAELTAAQVLQAAQDASIDLPEGKECTAHALGRYLSHRCGGVFGPCQLQRQGTDRSRKVLWKMTPVDPTGGAGAAELTRQHRQDLGTNTGRTESSDDATLSVLPVLPVLNPDLYARENSDAHIIDDLHARRDAYGSAESDSTPATPAVRRSCELNAVDRLPVLVPRSCRGSPQPPHREEAQNRARLLGWTDDDLNHVEDVWRLVDTGAEVLEVTDTFVRVAPYAGYVRTFWRPGCGS